MAIQLVTKFLPLVDELFTTESKKSMVTNNDFSWAGAHIVKIYKVSTSQMNDYDRQGQSGIGQSRYGAIQSLDATTEEFPLRKDRSFTFALDKLDTDETGFVLSAGSALARQLREVVVPEVDGYTFTQMCLNAGHKADPKALTSSNICGEILKANNTLDNDEVPETGRIIVVTPNTYLLMKQAKDIVFETDIGNELRLKGVIAMLDGAMIMRVPANRLPAGFGFMVCHPIATVAPEKLTDYTIHQNPPGISGSLVEGRIAYDAHVLENKACAIYYQATS